MHVVLAPSFLLVLLLISACSNAPEHYKDPDTGCAFSHPATWIRRNRQDLDTALRYTANQGGSTTPEDFLIIGPPGDDRPGFAPKITVMKFALEEQPAVVTTFLEAALVEGASTEGRNLVANPLPSCRLPHYALRVRVGDRDLLQYAFAFLGKQHLAIVIVAYGQDLEDPDVAGVIASIVKHD